MPEKLNETSWIGENSKIVGEKVTIGNNVQIGDNCFIGAREEVVIGDNTIINSGNLLAASYNISIGARNRFKQNGKYQAGEFIKIGDDNDFARGGCEVFGRSIEFGDYNWIEKITIGAGGSMGPNSHFKMGSYGMLCEGVFINLSEKVTIGDDVGIGYDVYLWTHGSFGNYFNHFPAQFEEIEIGDHAWIIMGTRINPGVRVGPSAIVTMNSVVNKTRKNDEEHDVPPNSIFGGLPGRLIKEDYTHEMSIGERIRDVTDMLVNYVPLINTKNGYAFKVQSLNPVILEEEHDTPKTGKIIYTHDLEGIIHENNGPTLYLTTKETDIEPPEGSSIMYLTHALGNRRIIGTFPDNALLQDLKDYLRRQGVKIFDTDHFKSIKPIDFENLDGILEQRD